MRIFRNYQDPHHLNTNAKKKKKDEDDEDKNEDKKSDDDAVVYGEKDKDTKRVQKRKINGHEWFTFRDK